MPIVYVGVCSAVCSGDRCWGRPGRPMAGASSISASGRRRNRPLPTVNNGALIDVFLRDRQITRTVDLGPAKRRKTRWHDGASSCDNVELAFSAFVYRTLTGGIDIYSAMVAMFTQRVWISAPIVAGAWLALILTTRWRPAPDWVGKAGRVLGICMVLAHFISMSC
jgi:hypothetical protein